ncbi:response regulator [Caulobacter segnis]
MRARALFLFSGEAARNRSAPPLPAALPRLSSPSVWILQATERSPCRARWRRRPLAPTILIVEDDPALRTLLMRLLREEGFQPLSAGHGAEMARVLETNTVDLILLDVIACPAATALICAAAFAARATCRSSCSAPATTRPTG